MLIISNLYLHPDSVAACADSNYTPKGKKKNIANANYCALPLKLYFILL